MTREVLRFVVAALLGVAALVKLWDIGGVFRKWCRDISNADRLDRYRSGP